MSSINEQLKAIDEELAELENQKQALIARKATLEKTLQLHSPPDPNKISAKERQYPSLRSCSQEGVMFLP